MGRPVDRRQQNARLNLLVSASSTPQSQYKGVVFSSICSHTQISNLTTQNDEKVNLEITTEAK
jgi:hypothetical protein